MSDTPKSPAPDPEPPFAGIDNIIHGDVLDVLAKIPRETVHLIITSPPRYLPKGSAEQGVAWPAVSIGPWRVGGRLLGSRRI